MPGSSGCKATETSRAPTYAEVVTQGEPSSRTTTSVSTATTPLLVAHTTSSRVTESVVPLITPVDASQKTIEIQTSPSLLQGLETTATSPPHRGDWSFEEEQHPPVGPHIMLQPIQAVERSPLEQRLQKRTHKEQRSTNRPEEPTDTLTPVAAGPENNSGHTGQTEPPLLVPLGPVSEADSGPCPYQAAVSPYGSEPLFSDSSEPHMAVSSPLSHFLHELDPLSQRSERVRVDEIIEHIPEEHETVIPDHSSPVVPRLTTPSVNTNSPALPPIQVTYYYPITNTHLRGSHTQAHLYKQENQ